MEDSLTPPRHFSRAVVSASVVFWLLGSVAWALLFPKLYSLVRTMTDEKVVSHGIYTVGPLAMSVILLVLSMSVCLIHRVLRPSFVKTLFPLSLVLFAIIEFLLLNGMVGPVLITTAGFKF